MTDLEPLTPEDCWRYLAKRVVGRIGFDIGHGPRIHPVNYRVDGEAVVFRTTDESELGRFVELFATGSLVAFEIDEIDYEQYQGWSVLLSGQLEQVDNPDELRRLHATWPRPWAGGTRNLLVRMAPTEVTGRRLGRA
jgi:nitroimidazol reductase NimA-like FMN-containing flavoprotein (pyridoxamine 5'-phosphate oxidase superfamily)